MKKFLALLILLSSTLAMAQPWRYYTHHDIYDDIHSQHAVAYSTYNEAELMVMCVGDGEVYVGILWRAHQPWLSDETIIKIRYRVDNLYAGMTTFYVAVDNTFVGDVNHQLLEQIKEGDKLFIRLTTYDTMKNYIFNLTGARDAIDKVNCK